MTESVRQSARTRRSHPVEHRASAARDYLLCERIAEGLDGSVYAARRKSDDVQVVIKSARAAESDLWIEAEALWLGRFATPHVVTLMDEVNLEGRAALVLPRAPLGSLAGAMGRLSTPALLAAVRDTLMGLAHLHAAEVVHLDVKPSNVLLTYDAQGFVIAQLADLSRAAQAAWGLRAGAFTPRFAAPELLQGRSASASVDVFALAMWLKDRPLEPGLAAWVARATEADPKARFANAGKAFAALAEVVDLAALTPALTRAFDVPMRSTSASQVGEETIPFDQPLALGHAAQAGKAQVGAGLRGRCTGPLRARETVLASVAAWMREGARARLIALEGPAGAGATRMLREVTTRALLEGAHVMRIDSESELSAWPPVRPMAFDAANAAARIEWLRELLKSWLDAGKRVVLLLGASAHWALPALRTLQREPRLSLVCDATGQVDDALPWTHRCTLGPLLAEEVSRILVDRGVDALEAARIALASGGLPARALTILRGGTEGSTQPFRDAPRTMAQDLQRMLALLALDGPQPFARFRLRAAALGVHLRSEHLAWLLRVGVYEVQSARLAVPSALEAEIARPAWRAALRHVSVDADNLRVARVAMLAGLPRLSLERLEAIPRESLPASDLLTFNAVLSTLDTSPRVEALRALTAYLRGDNLAAKKHCDVALQARARSVLAHAALTRGQVALSELDAETARLHASRAGALAVHADDRLRAAMLRARIDILTGQTRPAARLLRSVLAPLTEKARTTPLALRAASLLADTYSNSKLPLSAIRVARAAMHRAARAHAPLVRLITANTLVDSLVQCGRYDEAAQVGATLLEGASGPVAHYLAGNLAMAELRRGDVDAALRLLDEALRAVGAARHRLWAFLASVKALALSLRTEHHALEAWLGTMAPEAALLREVHDAVTLLDEVRERAGPCVDRWLQRT